MAGSCIGVVLLVMSLEFLRRGSREYDAFIVRQHLAANPPAAAMRGPSESDSDNKGPSVQAAPSPAPRRSFKPSLVQQLVRAVIHMAQFTVAYIIMLLAMYFNGYIIISIVSPANDTQAPEQPSLISVPSQIIGAFLGAFIFGWHSLALP